MRKKKQKEEKEQPDTLPVVLKCSECGDRVLVGWWWRNHVALIEKISCAKCKEGGTTRLPTLG